MASINICDSEDDIFRTTFAGSTCSPSLLQRFYKFSLTWHVKKINKNIFSLCKNLILQNIKSYLISFYVVYRI